MTVMDRRYGVSTSELRGDSYNREEVERQNAINKANKEEREFNKIVEYTNEIIAFANELKQSPFADLSEKGKSSLATAFLRISSEPTREQKINFLFATKIDTASLKVKGLKEVQEDVLGFLNDLEEVVVVAGGDEFINKTAAFQALKSTLVMKLEEKRVEKYMKFGNGMDRKTVQTLVQKGFLK